MNRRLRRATAAVGASALVGTGFGAASTKAEARSAAIAASLGVTPSEVRAARDEAEEIPDPRPLAQALADELDVDLDAVQEIVDADRSASPDRTTLLPALVTGLRLDEATVAAAFDRAEDAVAAEHRARIAAVVAKLAEP